MESLFKFKPWHDSNDRGLSTFSDMYNAVYECLDGMFQKSGL